MTHVEFTRCPVIIPYYGGKYNLSKELVPMLYPHERYIEVFAGGLSMFFRKTKSTGSIINDIDNDVVNLYITIAKEFDKFSDLVYWIPKSKDYYDKAKEVVHSGKIIEYPNVERAAAYYFVIKNSFNRNPNNSFSKKATVNWKHELVEELKYSREIMDNVLIENRDFRDLVKHYPPKDTDMWYLDPPYVVASERKSYYMHTFGIEEHKDVKDICDTINNADGKFMVSYDDRADIRDMFKDYNVKEIYTVYAGSADKKQRTELVITNYETQEQGILF
jgi:DNA adenine methylase|tara:strand:- start:211 stop:1038 length:828 start_codon:yes stop_codon:yes gene_type:complete